MASRALRVLCGIAVWGAVAILALMVIASGINAFDERLSPEALAMLHPPASQFSPDQNIYLSLVGLDAPHGQSVTVVGQQRVARYDKRVDLMLNDPALGVSGLTAEDPDRLQFVGSMDFFRQQDPMLWELIRAHASKIQPLIEQNHELYQRYLSLLELPGYYETARPSPLAPAPFTAASTVRKLYLADVCLGLQSGNEGRTAAALGRLRQDIDLWHRVLAGQGALISKMVAVAYLQIDSLLLADMIADPRTAIPADMEAYLPQFGAGEWHIGHAFRAEFRFHDFVYQEARAVTVNHWQPPDSSRAVRLWNLLWSPLESQFFKMHATENLAANLMNTFAQSPVPTPATFAVDQARLQVRVQESTEPASVRTLYNPIGKYLVSIAAPEYGNYLLRPYDAAALQRLVRLSVEIRRQNVAPASVAAFMKLHPEWSTHPADGRTFLWDQAKAEIAVQPVAKQAPDRRFSAHIWKVSGG